MSDVHIHDPYGYCLSVLSLVLKRVIRGDCICCRAIFTMGSEIAAGVIGLLPHQSRGESSARFTFSGPAYISGTSPESFLPFSSSPTVIIQRVRSGLLYWLHVLRDYWGPMQQRLFAPTRRNHHQLHLFTSLILSSLILL